MGYDQVKNYSPMLKDGLENIESRIPADWVKRVTAASDPFIDVVDNQLDRRVIVPVHDLRKATGDKVVQWKSMRGDLSKKAVVRIENGLTAAREFSSHRGKEILHFDLIAYSQEVLDNANAVAKPLYEPVQQNMAAAVLKLNAAMTALQEAAVAKSAEMKAQFSARLQAAIIAARALSSASVQFVNQKYHVISAKLPEEQKLLAMAEHLPYPAKDAVQFILHSPQLFLEVKSKADITTSKHIVENANSLMAAVKEVIFVRPESMSS